MLSREFYTQKTVLDHHLRAVCLRIYYSLTMIKSIEKGFSLGRNEMK
jgi:hypothetical protein